MSRFQCGQSANGLSIISDRGDKDSNKEYSGPTSNFSDNLRPSIVVFAVKKIDQGSSYCWNVVGLDAASARQYPLVVTPAAAYDLLGRDVNRNIGARVEKAKKLLEVRTCSSSSLSHTIAVLTNIFIFCTAPGRR